MKLRTDPTVRLAQFIKENRKIVFVTGAGLSASSGIPTFRGTSTSIWSQKAMCTGTKHSYTRLSPNQGHEAIAQLASRSQNITVITQNIDTLHQKTAHPWPVEDQLIEIHGRLGYYHCTSDENDCSLATEVFATTKDIFPCELTQAIEEEDSLSSPPQVNHETLPRCPECGRGLIMPLALMFDEDYTSHAFYQFDKAMNRIEEAEILVFVGTSFQVNITALALKQAKERCIPVFNFNLEHSLNGAGRRYPVFNVMGPAEESLHRLVELTTVENATPQASAIESGSSMVDASYYLLEPPLPQPLSAELVQVDFSPRYGRHAHPSLEGCIETIWKQTQEKFPRVFNGLKFRLHKCESIIGSNTAGIKRNSCGEEVGMTSSSSNMLLKLSLWLTDYKTYRGTNCNPEAKRWKEDGLRDFGDENACLSQKLGVSIMLSSSDGKIVLIRRSDTGGVSECLGFIDTPGGHPEPSNLAITSLSPSSSADSDDIIGELFASAQQEIVDEINIPAHALSCPYLMGIVYQLHAAGTPSLAFSITTSLTSKEIKSWYAKGPKEGDESSELLFIDQDQVSCNQLNLTPAAKGCFVLYKRYYLG